MSHARTLRYLRLALHGDQEQKREAAAYLLIAEEELRREEQEEARWAEQRSLTRPSFSETAIDICRPAL